MKAIVEAGHKVGAIVGFDLAHGAGNLKLHLHDWNVDFAAWCSYKYLNGGPGCVAGAFVHEQHHKNTDMPLFAGWWGHDKATRFKMDREFVPIQSVERWQLSNAPILSMAAYKASLDMFDEVGMDKLNEKIREFEKQSGLDIYGLGARRDKWEATLEKFTELIVNECSGVVENQGRFLRYDTLAKKIKENLEIKK
jgi:selenocysteine lyase/cysteine desulfurase